MKRLLACLAFAATLLPTVATAGVDAPALYTQHCASCHGPGRLGAMGPALLPESLERLRRADAIATLRDGRTATQMPAFGAILSAAEIEALADWVRTPVSPAPAWSEDDIRASRVEPFPRGSLPDAPQGPVAQTDPMNLFIVVEAGDHHVSVLDGDRMERIHRFPSRYALHGGPKFTPDGRYVFFASRDGWVSKFDIWNLKVVAEVRAGLNARNAAVSSDGRYVAVANYLPGNLVIFDADLKLLKIIVDDNSFGYSGFIGTDVEEQYKVRLRKTFLQFMLVSILFHQFGYNYEGWKSWDGTSIDSAGLKCKIANTEQISNAANVCEFIIIDRLSDGSYQDYGDHLRKNLGLYRCSCGYFYSIGNCGYAMEKKLCPKCGLEIGGGNHAILNRDGHLHIKTLPEMFGIIMEMYYAACGKYNMHTVVNHTPLEFFPFKINEVGKEQFTCVVLGGTIENAALRQVQHERGAGLDRGGAHLAGRGVDAGGHIECQRGAVGLEREVGDRGRDALGRTFEAVANQGVDHEVAIRELVFDGDLAGFHVTGLQDAGLPEDLKLATDGEARFFFDA